MARVVALIDYKQKLALLPYTDPESARLLSSVPMERQGQTWWFVGCDGTTTPGNHGGGIAVLHVILLTRWIAFLCAKLNLSPMLDKLDRYVAIKRSGWSDFVPEGSAPRRYP